MNLSVRSSGISQTESDMNGAKRKLSSYRGNVESTKNRCRLSGSSGRNIVRSLDAILEEMEKEESLLNSLQNAAVRAGELYQEYEKEIAELHAAEATEARPGEAEAADEGPGEVPAVEWSDIWELIGEAGIVGSLAGAGGSLITGTGVEDLLSSGKFVVKTVGASAEAVKNGNTSADWAEQLFGTYDGLKDLDVSSAGKTFSSSLKNQWDDLFAPELATTADKVKLAAKWTGNILTLTGNAIENVQEMQEDGISFGRATAETAIETGVDIGMGMAATAAVSAGAVALGITAAPALAIGAGAAVVVWGVNSVCERLTEGKDVGEVVADAVCDVGEGAVSLIRDAGEAVGNAVEAAGDAIWNGVSAAWSGFCGVFG